MKVSALKRGGRACPTKCMHFNKTKIQQQSAEGMWYGTTSEIITKFYYHKGKLLTKAK